MAPRIERSASRLAGMLRSRLRPAVAISGFARHRRESPLLPKLWHVISFVGEEKSKNNTACAVPGSQSRIACPSLCWNRARRAIRGRQIAVDYLLRKLFSVEG